MTISKEKVIDQITVVENGTVIFREVTRIIEDGAQISQIYHRASLTPGQDLTDIPENVAAICGVAWTPEIVSAYQVWLKTK